MLPTCKQISTPQPVFCLKNRKQYWWYTTPLSNSLFTIKITLPSEKICISSHVPFNFELCTPWVCSSFGADLPTKVLTYLYLVLWFLMLPPIHFYCAAHRSILTQLNSIVCISVYIHMYICTYLHRWTGSWIVPKYMFVHTTYAHELMYILKVQAHICHHLCFYTC